MALLSAPSETSGNSEKSSANDEAARGTDLLKKIGLVEYTHFGQMIENGRNTSKYLKGEKAFRTKNV